MTLKFWIRFLTLKLDYGIQVVILSFDLGFGIDLIRRDRLLVLCGDKIG